MKGPVIILALTLGALLSGCANQTSIVTPDPRDPLESINRATYEFNDGLDQALVKPVAQTYARVVPQPMQTGVSNFFSHAKYPVTLANNILQGKFTHAANDVVGADEPNHTTPDPRIGRRNPTFEIVLPPGPPALER